MNILADAIVTNSEIIKNYKSCRENAENFGKIFIFKNNQPDAVLFSIKEYQRLSEIIEYLQNFEKEEIENLILNLQRKNEDKNNLISITKKDIIP